MKLPIFCFVLLFSFSHQKLPDTINEIINKIKEALPEVLTIDTLSHEFSNSTYISGYLNATDVILKGLKTFDLQIEYSWIVPKSLVLTLDGIDLQLNYDANIALLNKSLLSVFGKGKISTTLQNFTVTADIDIASISLTNTSMHLDDAKFNIEGLMEDEAFSTEISELLTDDVAKIVNENVITSAIEDVINTLIAEIIANLSTTTPSPTTTESYNSNTVEEHLETDLLHNQADNIQVNVEDLFEKLITELYKYETN